MHVRALRLLLLVPWMTAARDYDFWTDRDSDFWTAMDPGYNTSFLEPVEEIETGGSILQCSVLALDRGVGGFGYEEQTGTCILLGVDYYTPHTWHPGSEVSVYLRDEEIIDDDYVDGCGFFMPVLESLLSWNEADTECWGHPSGGASLLEIDAGTHECVVMQLQYLRKPSTNSYWTNGRYEEGMWQWTVSGLGVEDFLWLPGEPDMDQSKQCVLLEAGGRYGLRPADCSEKHYALCEYWHIPA